MFPRSFLSASRANCHRVFLILAEDRFQEPWSVFQIEYTVKAFADACYWINQNTPAIAADIRRILPAFIKKCKIFRHQSHKLLISSINHYYMDLEDLV